MENISKDSVQYLRVGDDSAGQRIDNFLVRTLKGVPKSHIYRILRSGEVRVNRRRAAPDYRLLEGDELRLPPVRCAERTTAASQATSVRLAGTVLYEDEALLVIDKPAGLAVHGGSGVSHGVIEQLRHDRPQQRYLELVHRLDRETSGVLMLAKKRSALVRLHEDLREGRVEKFYRTLVAGGWRDEKRHVRVALRKFHTPEGERRVCVDPAGQQAHTIFTRLQAWPEFSLLQAELKTGRTHQIRVHLAHLGFPIAGDDKYGDFSANKALEKRHLRRMFLHAYCLRLVHPVTGTPLEVVAPLPADLQAFLDRLDRMES